MKDTEKGSQDTDITEDTNREEQLPYPANVLECISEAIITTDLDFVIDRWNAAAARLYGWDASAVRGKRIDDVIETTYPDRAPQAVLEAFLREGKWKGEAIQTRKNGDKIHVLSSVNTMKDQHGNPIGVIAINRNISNRKQTEKALKESQRAMKTLLSNLPGLAYRCKNTPLWPFEFVSEGCRNLTGYAPDVFLNQQRFFESLIHPDDRQAVWDQVQAALAQQRPFRLAYRIITADDEEKWVWEQGVGIFDEEGEIRALEGFITDITERKRMIEALEAQNAELERFTYTVSHDLKTPLVTINGFLGLLQEDAIEGNITRMMADMEQINNAVDRMGSLLQALLHLSRVGRLTNPSERVDLNEMVHEAVNLIAGQIDTQGIAVEIAPDLPPVFGDRIRLLEVWQNVIDNAVKFTGDQPAPRIAIEARKDGGMVRCSVSDNGIGIDPRYHDKIFGLFERLNASVSGTGVGLALVKRIVEWHGGRVWIASDGLGQGTTFYFTLPKDSQVAD